ncbi:MAG TPA: DNA polymerase III subunit gamma/tau [Aquifex aeolicus]|nr:DNA polymerase III subunit gamma/tau [Aquifex aeolicus]
MVYIPFARKYRPKFFKEVIGQDVAVRILKNAIRNNRVAHAYLFAGPRGVGKTTIARILAKALNCKNPSEGEPCGECEHCREIDRGIFPDLIEMDAASNRGIDDIRTLKEAVNYKPIKGKYKVYIIDEAHMLTKEAFNALLKTLEEPPQNTVFVLCTTEYDKILPTILSRCQRIIFSKVSKEKVIEYLKKICEKENIEYEEKALELLTHASEGCMRDAASLLDQASVYGEGKVNKEVVENFLGILSQETVRKFLRLLLNSEVDEAIKFLNELAEKGYNLGKFWEMLEEEVRNAILVKSLKNPGFTVENWRDYEEFKEFPLEALLYVENLINRGKVEARTREPLRAYELAVIKSLIVKDILPISQLGKIIGKESSQKGNNDKPKEEETVEKTPGGKEVPPMVNIEEIINSIQKPLIRRLIEDAEKEEKDGKIVIKVDLSYYKSYKKEFEKLKELYPFLEYELLEVKKKSSDRNKMKLF